MTNLARHAGWRRLTFEETLICKRNARERRQMLADLYRHLRMEGERDLARKVYLFGRAHTSEPMVPLIYSRTMQ